MCTVTCVHVQGVCLCVLTCVRVHSGRVYCDVCPGRVSVCTVTCVQGVCLCVL